MHVFVPLQLRTEKLMRTSSPSSPAAPGEHVGSTTSSPGAQVSSTLVTGYAVVSGTTSSTPVGSLDAFITHSTRYASSPGARSKSPLVRSGWYTVEPAAGQV